MPESAAVEKRIARALSLAVQQPTLSAGDEAPFLQLHQVLRDMFPRLFEAARVEVIDRRSLLICLPGSGKAQPLLFLSHMDVAPIRQNEKWSSPPFSGEIRNGFVWGRGTADMKGHMISLLTAAEMLLCDQVRPKADIWFAFSADEEIRGGSMQKMSRILQGQGVQPAFVLDEGGCVTKLPFLPGKETALVGVSEKGRMAFTLSAAGENAEEALLQASKKVLRFRFSPRLCPVTRQMLEALSPNMKGISRFCARHPTLLKHALTARLKKTVWGPSLTRTQLHISALRGDAMRGVDAGIAFQSSILPGDSVQKLLSRIQRKIRDDRVLITVDVMDEPSLVSPTEGMAWDALATAIQVHFPGIPSAPFMITGSTDARRMENISPYVYRFSPFILPPEEIARMHRADERISIENLVRACGFFRQMMLA